ncbi:GGDEF domain-containing protein [Muricomes intestini]|jgi:diguanylate cyclase (GGDEF)-like protein|uniref:Diguanylate cyclase (GGDEF)-like protein n=1 Tax=Muricomes intestini TaxID=1796634 RepID=A0A4V2UST5_9FIRM|nr:GGDEF domain-containing protein [Muricomes intestini]TCS82688.1 diguanylate cyclase (GGDEF)-like protein [Muricomes intestini]HCR84656.1 hypothetical protein [Lachnospiraceae bacterium]
MESVAALLQNYLDNVINDPEHAYLDLRQLPEEFREFGEGLVYFSKCAIETAGLVKEHAFMFNDISSQKRRLYDLQVAAYTDDLTQLFNRRYGMKTLNEWLGDNRLFILCFADIDNLKYVNDQFGHCEGDKYIIAVADILRGFSQEAVLCRIGGDEFMILAQDWSGDSANEQMEMLRNRVINCEHISGRHYYRNISYGIVEIRTDNTLSASDILSIADEKMYEYKRVHHKGRARNKRN